MDPGPLRNYREGIVASNLKHLDRAVEIYPWGTL
jgi:hypothetical protein